jgi:hypothetical protein
MVEQLRRAEQSAQERILKKRHFSLIGEHLAHCTRL